MKDKKKAEDIAVQRFQLLATLLATGLDPAKASQLKAAICEETGLSERTVRRYLAQYREAGFDGLRPKPKGRKPTSDAIPAELLEEAILLRREVPGRSVSQIIQIHVWEGKARPGQLKRSTLQEKLTERGYSSRQMRMYASSGVAAVIVPKPGQTIELEQLQAFCRKSLTGYKIPRALYSVSQLPRNASGKILKYKLREDVKKEVETTKTE